MSTCFDVPSACGAFSRPMRHGELMTTFSPSCTRVRDHWLICVAPFLNGSLRTSLFHSFPSAFTVTAFVPNAIFEMSTDTSSKPPFASHTRKPAVFSFM